MTKVWVLIEADLHMDDPVGDTPIIGVFSSRDLAIGYLADLYWQDSDAEAATITWSDGQNEGPCGGWERADHWVALAKATPEIEGGLFQLTAFELDEPS